MSGARITSFLVKIASRCNLDCDYCYVYHHADQSWRNMPRLLSDEHQSAFVEKLAEYLHAEGLKRAAVIYHGGEPLLAGHAQIVAFTRQIRSVVGPGVDIDFGLQTNGLILTEDALDAFEAEQISVSLSMDGPRVAHDIHRTTRKGRSSFKRVEAALERLKRRPSIFSGVIAVIDAGIEPEVLLSYFAAHNLPKVDFLLPDSHHERPPPGRDLDSARYEQWLVRAFDLWFDRYPELPVRTFEALLDVVAGLPSGTDAFGLGDVSLITLETDGTWHDLDVLKVVGDGATRLVGSVADTTIKQVASSATLASHRRILTKAGLCATCRECDIVDICGGGAVPHRFGNGSFDNPTIYCSEMKALVQHVRWRLKASLADAPINDAGLPTFDLADFELAETSEAIVSHLQGDALTEDIAGLGEAMAALGIDHTAVDADTLRGAARRAGTVSWQRAQRAASAGKVVRGADGTPIHADLGYLDHALHGASGVASLEVGCDDPWLRNPFGSGILFEADDVAERGRMIVEQALLIVATWRPALEQELRTICSAVQFVRDPSAHPEKIVSFSDNSVPGALFVSIVQGGGFIDPYDLADSLIHEYRHQKLYLLERCYPTARPGSLVVSPWRDDLRPASGLLHAIFVFVELQRFWEYVRDDGPLRLHSRAAAQLEDTERNLAEAFATLRGCDLTIAGRALADVLESRKRQMTLAAECFE